MTDISMGPAKLNVGGVFSQALETLKSKLLFFVFTGLMLGIGNLALARSGVNDPHRTAVSPGFVVISMLILLVLGMVTQVLTARATATRLGENPSIDFVPAVQASLPKFLPLFLTALAYALLVGVFTSILTTHAFLDLRRLRGEAAAAPLV